MMQHLMCMMNPYVTQAMLHICNTSYVTYQNHNILINKQIQPSPYNDLVILKDFQAFSSFHSHLLHRAALHRFATCSKLLFSRKRHFML